MILLQRVAMATAKEYNVCLQAQKLTRVQRRDGQGRYEAELDRDAGSQSALAQTSTSYEPIIVPRLQRLFVANPLCLDYLRAPRLEEIAIWGNTTHNTETSRKRFLSQRRIMSTDYMNNHFGCTIE
jgi:hypothetical protein